jgi:nicotinate dehydrogenase subunit A
MSSTYRLSVNGAIHQVTVDYADTPLLYVLRDDLKLKGTRFGCGTGECGACTVLIDGRAAKSCDVPVWSAEGEAIITIEGLGTVHQLHPLQRAILDLQAAQCGYCLSGIIMKAVELVQRDASPARAKIVEALAANLCRCGAHTRIVKAIEIAWKEIAQDAHR